MYEVEIIKYLLKECHGLHPYYISRIVALLDMEYIKERGAKLTDFDYQKMDLASTAIKYLKFLTRWMLRKCRVRREIILS